MIEEITEFKAFKLEPEDYRHYYYPYDYIRRHPDFDVFIMYFTYKDRYALALTSISKELMADAGIDVIKWMKHQCLKWAKEKL